MTERLTDGDWCFFDRSRTTAEIILRMYEVILESAGDMVIMGCNTLSHLCAGLVHINRTGDDTSGREWERTRRARREHDGLPSLPAQPLLRR